MGIPTLEALAAEASRMVYELSPERDRATLVTLSGELGAGKTAFTRAIAAALGVEEPVTSPTFVIEKIYRLPSEHKGRLVPFARLVHIDAYRLESGKELAPLGFDDALRDPSTLMLLEWPEKVAGALPEPTRRIRLVADADGARTLSYE